MRVPSLLMATKSGPFCGVDSSWQLLASCVDGLCLGPDCIPGYQLLASVPYRRVSFPSSASCYFSPFFPAPSFRGGTQHNHDSVFSPATVYCFQRVDRQKLESLTVVKRLHKVELRRDTLVYRTAPASWNKAPITTSFSSEDSDFSRVHCVAIKQAQPRV